MQISLTAAGKALACIGLAATLVVLVSSAGAQEAPYTFDVDVDVQELHERVSDIHVRCAIYGEREGIALGQGDAIQKVSDGAFKGAVRVAVSMSDGYAPEDALRYACRLRLIVEGSEPAKPNPGSGEIALRPRRGPPFTPLISGSL